MSGLYLVGQRVVGLIFLGVGGVLSKNVDILLKNNKMSSPVVILTLVAAVLSFFVGIYYLSFIPFIAALLIYAVYTIVVASWCLNEYRTNINSLNIDVTDKQHFLISNIVLLIGGVVVLAIELIKLNSNKPVAGPAPAPAPAAFSFKQDIFQVLKKRKIPVSFSF